MPPSNPFLARNTAGVILGALAITAGDLETL